MENKMYAKPQYKCGVCGKIFDDLKERSNCEIACLKKQDEEAKRILEAQKKEEQAVRKAKVDEDVKRAAKSIKEYIKDYGIYSLDNEEVKEFLWTNKFLNYFL